MDSILSLLKNKNKFWILDTVRINWIQLFLSVNCLFKYILEIVEITMFWKNIVGMCRRCTFFTLIEVRKSMVLITQSRAHKFVEWCEKQRALHLNLESLVTRLSSSWFFSWPPKEASSWNPNVWHLLARSLFPTEILNFEARTLKLET